jgi:hypothetical protein
MVIYLSTVEQPRRSPNDFMLRVRGRATVHASKARKIARERRDVLITQRIAKFRHRGDTRAGSMFASSRSFWAYRVAVSCVCGFPFSSWYSQSCRAKAPASYNGLRP